MCVRVISTSFFFFKEGYQIRDYVQEIWKSLYENPNNKFNQIFNKYLFSVYYVQGTILDQWSSTRGMLPPRVQLTISGDIFDRSDLRWGWRDHWHLVGRQARDATEYPTMHKTHPYNKELFSPKISSTKVEKTYSRY